MDAKKMEMVIKALECCKSGYCYGGCCCPYDDDEDDTLERCTSMLSADALTLIKELIEENEKQKKTMERLVIVAKMAGAPFPEGLDIVHKYCEKRDQFAKADTVRKMQDSIAVHFGTYTTEDYVRVLDVIRVISLIGEELLSEGEE